MPTHCNTPERGCCAGSFFAVADGCLPDADPPDSLVPDLF